ncbi:unnamed protein product [Trichobilharzia regenti]|nr:unnamed protein product [Trichobilharzia regenti]
MLCLQECDLTIPHVPEEENVLPDILSRTYEVELPEIAYGAIALERDPARLVMSPTSDNTLKIVIQVITNAKTGESPHSESLVKPSAQTERAAKPVCLWNVNVAGG